MGWHDEMHLEFSVETGLTHRFRGVRARPVMAVRTATVMIVISDRTRWSLIVWFEARYVVWCGVVYGM